MRQLTSLDVQFLAAEHGRTHGHVSAVSILDPATAPEGKLPLADITRVFRERLHLLPPLCWRLVEVALGLDYPRWLDDPDFDLEFHPRELYLPPPREPGAARRAGLPDRLTPARPRAAAVGVPTQTRNARIRRNSVKTRCDRRCLCTNDVALAWRRSLDRAERVAGPLAPPYLLTSEGVTPPA